MANSMDCSPSIYHRKLMDSIKPELAYGGGDVKSWQRKLRNRLRTLLGMPKNVGAPLKVRSLWKRKTEFGSIEKIVFQSEPGADVPAYVCLPETPEQKMPWLICVQGHSTGMHNSIGVQLEDNSKPLVVGGDRDFGLHCMKRGIAALCIEQRSFGERAEKVQKVRSARMCHEASMHALFLGHTLLGERVFDIDRGIDYLYTRDDVDRKRLGVMGNSGGGTATMFSAAVLPRVKIAMPSCYFCTFKDSIMSLHHCECNYVPGLYQYAEMADIMGLFAPKPVVIVAGDKDDIFPIGAVRKEFKRLQKIYSAAGASGNCKLVVGKEGHRFYADDAMPVYLKALEKLQG